MRERLRRAKVGALSIRVYIDADACPVKEDTFKVSKRYSLHVFVVSNSPITLPRADWIEPVVVGSDFDAVDDWIVDHAAADDIVVTADTPLAARCLPKVAAVVHPTGRRFTDDDIGSALAMRDLLAQLRESGTRTRGPAPFTDRDRSAFLQTLDAAIQKARRAR